MEKISVIVPVYNVEKFLEKCVSSILKQTYSNLEIILVDDGSKDNSGMIADQLAKKDRRIKVIHKENGGLSSARNEGLKYATGDYIAFLDSDDCIIMDFYEYLYHMIQKYDVDIAQGDFLRIPDDDIDRVNDILQEENAKRRIEEKVLTKEEALEVLYGTKEGPYIQEVVVWNKLYRKSIFETIVFPIGKLHEDEFTTHKILFRCRKIAISNRMIYGYMQTKNSIMRKEIGLNRVNDCLGASLDAISFFEKNGMKGLTDKIVMRYLENCIELSGKIGKENSENKEEKLKYLQNRFEEFYQNYIEEVKGHIIEDIDKKALVIVEKAYQEKNLVKYWEELDRLIH